MMSTQTAARRDDIRHAPNADFATAVIEGLTRTPKSLPCRFFYDDRGSALFEEITQLPEYYPTRTETAILRQYAQQMVGLDRGLSVLVEFGSGSSRKTETLIAAMPELAAYVPVDVSIGALADARRRLNQRFPRLDVRPIVADFSTSLMFPRDLAQLPKVGFFPGSTIGNFVATDAIKLLRLMRRSLTHCTRMIIGVDLKKDARRLVSAYNDAAGVTAAFNLNLLARINRELEAAIDLAKFRHEAIYNAREGRVEMHLVSRCDHAIDVCGRRFHFAAGETIHTENSYKYTIAEFQDLADRAGWRLARTWTDVDALFSVNELVPL